MDNNTVYTIGYTGFRGKVVEFIKTLHSYSISLVVDVRSTPYSRQCPEYDKEFLSLALKGAGIYYRNYAREFGARQEDPQYCLPSYDYLDFEKYAKAPAFLEGVEKLMNSIEKGYTFALMCAEKHPVNCHRSILISRTFYERGCKVVHIMPDGVTITQKDVENILTDKTAQDCLFATSLDDGRQILNEAYRNANLEIAKKQNKNLPLKEAEL